MNKQRVVVWFSCGAASAVAAKRAVDRFSKKYDVRVVYCDTSTNEHPDNLRFLKEVEKWLGMQVERIKSNYSTVEEVFEDRKYMAGIAGAVCTAQMKKVPRFNFQKWDDIHVFGFTADEEKRISRFEKNNHELKLCWVLRDEGITKKDCYGILIGAGIKLPEMYLLGYKNNNCIGCVKATSPAYWNKIRKDFPEVFERRAKQSRKIGCKLTRIKGKRIFLDELPEGDYGRYKMEDISCGPDCGQDNIADLLY